MIKKISVVFIILLCASLALPAYSQENKKKKPVIRMPDYTILDEDVLDIPFKTHVQMEILVSGTITEEGLNNLLKMLYSSIAKRKYKYHTFPTFNVYIYVYSSYKDYKSSAAPAQSNWMAILSKNYDETKPTIMVNPLKLGPTELKTEEKFGLSERERRAIWKKLIRAEGASFKKADIRYPMPNLLEYPQPRAGEKLRKKMDFQRKAFEEDMEGLAKKHGLENDQIRAILNEGIEKGWNLP